MTLDKNILECLPEEIRVKLMEYNEINEIRIRKNCPLCITVGKNNLVTTYVCTNEDIEFCISHLCKNSFYAYIEQIKQGYIPLENGYRVGICGRSVTENNIITNICDIQGINIRVPNTKLHYPDGLLDGIEAEKGIMVYSPPAYGKSSLLKAIIKNLSSPPKNKRIAVIDCKYELYSEDMHKGLPADFYVGYPKYQAIDMAIRNMSPEIIVCDEIGISDDVSPIIECKNCGVNVICSAHARDIGELKTRPNIQTLHKLKVFNGYLGISYKNGKRVYKYDMGKEIV